MCGFDRAGDSVTLARDIAHSLAVVPANPRNAAFSFHSFLIHVKLKDQFANRTYQPDRTPLVRTGDHPPSTRRAPGTGGGGSAPEMATSGITEALSSAMSRRPG